MNGLHHKKGAPIWHSCNYYTIGLKIDEHKGLRWGWLLAKARFQDHTHTQKKKNTKLDVNSAQWSIVASMVVHTHVYMDLIPCDKNNCEMVRWKCKSLTKSFLCHEIRNETAPTFSSQHSSYFLSSFNILTTYSLSFHTLPSFSSTYFLSSPNSIFSLLFQCPHLLFSLFHLIYLQFAYNFTYNIITSFSQKVKK